MTGVQTCALPISRGFWLAAGIYLGITGIIFHAGRPRSVEGTPLTGVRLSNTEKSGLRINPESAQIYDPLLAVIREQTKPSDALFVFPNNAEIYFLSGRKNPFSFFNTANAFLYDDSTESEVITQLKDHPPKVIIHNRECVYNCPETSALLKDVRKNYRKSKSIGPFDIYL